MPIRIYAVNSKNFMTYSYHCEFVTPGPFSLFYLFFMVVEVYIKSIVLCGSRKSLFVAVNYPTMLSQ